MDLWKVIETFFRAWLIETTVIFNNACIQNVQEYKIAKIPLGDIQVDNTVFMIEQVHCTYVSILYLKPIH